MIQKNVPNYPRLRTIYSQMKTRCFNTKADNYQYYGGRGITICDEWKGNFRAFCDWATANGYADNLTIDRKNNNEGYSPDNCRWVTAKEQCNNRTNNINIIYNGESHTIPEWSAITGIKQHDIRNRIKRGWKIDDVLTRKVRKYVYQNRE